MYSKIDVQIVGSNEVLQKIRELNYRSARYAARYALTGAAIALVKYLKAGTNTPVWSGMLQSAWGYRRSHYKSKFPYALVGVRRDVSGFRVPAGVQKLTKGRVKRDYFTKKGLKRPERQTPARYFHLMEWGHAGPKGRGWVEGKFVLHKAVQAAGPEMQSIVIQRLKERLARLDGPEVLEES